MIAMTTSNSIKVKPEAADLAPFGLALRKRSNLFIVNPCQVAQPSECEHVIRSTPLNSIKPTDKTYAALIEEPQAKLRE